MKKTNLVLELKIYFVKKTKNNISFENLTLVPIDKSLINKKIY